VTAFTGSTFFAAYPLNFIFEWHAYIIVVPWSHIV